MRAKRMTGGRGANEREAEGRQRRTGGMNGLGGAGSGGTAGIEEETAAAADRATGARAGREALGTVLADLEAVFDDLDALARTMAGLDDASLDDLARLAPPICELLEARRGLVAGAGLITAPDFLRDAPRWLEWWWTPGAGAPQRLRINLDPAAPDFYDYTTAEWYASPRHSGARSVAGPYVDYACTGEYAVTLSTPVVRGADFLGVAAADVLVSSLEGRVLPALLAVGRPVALTNSHGRVIASNSPHVAPGLRVDVAGHSSTPAVTVDRTATGDIGGDSGSEDGGSPLRSWLLVDVAADAG
ncbi:MAG TPA: cache domain-containing protein [Actinocrinis sp.]|nr:cache domain-containing protein [Actinocrinis sp.]